MGLRSHGEHVGKRVGSCHTAELVGVINHGGEEIYCEHANSIVAQLPYCAVVACFIAKQQAFVWRRRTGRGER